MFGLTLLIASTANRLTFAADTASAAPPGQPSAPQAQMSPPELDRVIKDVVSQRKYAWRMPREMALEEDANKGPVARFFSDLGKTLRGWSRAAIDWLERLLEKLFKSNRTSPHGGRGILGWITSVQGLIFLLTTVVVCALAILLYRLWRRHHNQTKPTEAAPVSPTPDLADETVDANQLPEDGWMQLGRELLGRGELRLAMRAFYLATLAHLAGRNLLAIARSKSNRDYERELCRRAHALPGLVSAFGENVSVFDRIWYGMHAVNDTLLDDFAANVEKIKAIG